LSAPIRDTTASYAERAAENQMRGPLGSTREIVDDCRYDWRAWLDFAEAQGYRRICLWGHSLGAVKTVYYLSQEKDARVICAVASSPPRFSHSTYLKLAGGERFAAAWQRAEALVAAGNPDELVRGEPPNRSLSFTARTYLDKFGPHERYNVLRLLGSFPH